jgi:regulator of protease activity HflC (stomatin/prohibitin superfamily)
MPWYRVEKMDKTVQVYTCANFGSRTDVDETDRRMTDAKRNSVQGTTIWAPTVDGIKMGFAISASWKIDPEYAWWIYDNVSELDDSNNGRFLWLEENVIKAKLKSALALTASKYTPIEVYSNKREEIQELTYEKMKKDIQDYHLILEQIDIREVYYNEEYEKAINQKKLEEQKALTLIEVTKQKEELLKQADIEKNIEITKAEAEAKALQIKGQSISNNPRVVELEWINKWNGELPTYMLGGNQSVLLGMPTK